MGDKLLRKTNNHLKNLIQLLHHQLHLIFCLLSNRNQANKRVSKKNLIRKKFKMFYRMTKVFNNTMIATQNSIVKVSTRVNPSQKETNSNKSDKLQENLQLKREFLE